MTDLELLELAAKAACIEVVWSDYVSCLCLRGRLPYYVAWDPLTNDGDALRLAVGLEMLVESSDWGCIAATGDGEPHYAYVDGQSVGVPRGDRCAAMRRAIVRAAAEIGRRMQGAS